MACRARQHSDQMVCTACGLAWDVNDLDPPPCDPNNLTVDRPKDKTEAERREFVATTKRKYYWPT